VGAGPRGGTVALSAGGDEELRRELEELRGRAARRAAFVAAVAHDLRTPLAAIAGSVQTLQQRDDELSREQRDALLGVIGTEADRLAALVSEVFDAARIDADAFSYELAELELGAVVSEAAAAAVAAGAGVECRVEQGMPAVRGDRERLRQVLSNLIDNAVKFSPPGAAVEVTARADGSRVVVDVTDRGVGIAAEHQELIFEQLGRVDGTGKPGTGLGLYIARAIAEAHSGTLTVVSAPGAGATFTLAVPAAP
jgi:signal transduction histidine kinase